MTVIYFNPSCSKCNLSLDLLKSKDIQPTVINYLETPPSKEELKNILNMMGKQPQDIIRFFEQPAKALNLSAQDDRPLDEWLDIMVTHPILIQRPIVVNGDKAVVARPPENLLDII